LEEAALKGASMPTKIARHTKVADDYLALINRFPLVPIKNARHLKEAFELLDELSIADEEKLTGGQADYLLVLTDLVEKYEDAHHPIENAFEDGIAALAFLLDEHVMTASDLGRLLGNRQLGAAILRRERQLSKAHVIKLANHFKVSTDLLIFDKTSKGNTAN
jgi:antitoxin component HigA of HigAB toxin-antitoxin module